MKNIINYYYNIDADNITKNNDNYYFKSNNNDFIFMKFNNDMNKLNSMVTLSQILDNYNFDRIIFNKDNNPLTNYDSNN